MLLPALVHYFHGALSPAALLHSDTDCKASWAVKQPSLLYSFSGSCAPGSRHWGWGALLLPVQINNFLNGDFKYIGMS